MQKLNPIHRARNVLIMSVVLTGWGLAGAAEQQASFAVAITLHTISKPVNARQLCPEGKPLDRLGVSISISCPPVDGGPILASDALSGLTRTAGPLMAPTVFVTF